MMSLRAISYKLLDSYILKQLIDFYLLGVVIFTLIAFFSDTFLNFVQDIQKLGISLTMALVLMGLQIPKMISLVLPASSFLSVLMVFNSMNATFEIIAFRMNGISLNRLLIPALILGVFSSIMAYTLGDYVVPYCNKQAELLKQVAIEKGSLPIGQDSFMFKDYDESHQLREMIYVGKYKGRQLKDSTIVDLTRPGAMQVIQSKRGEWHPDRWEFENANAYTVSKTSELLVFNHLGKFTVRNLIQRKADAEQQAESIRRKVEGLEVDSDTMPFIRLFKVIQKREAIGKRVARVSYIKLWEKITLPLSCLVMILIAVPLAITPPRQGTNRGFIYALGVLFLYYVLRSVCVAFGKSGSLTLGGVLSLPESLMLAAWLPLLMIVLFGMILLVRKSKTL